MPSEVEVEYDCEAHEGKRSHDGGGHHAAVVAVLFRHSLVSGGGQSTGINSLSVEGEHIGLDCLPVGEVSLQPDLVLLVRDQGGHPDPLRRIQLGDLENRGLVPNAVFTGKERWSKEK